MCACVSVHSLARFWADAQELLLNDPEVLQLGRVWRELTTMSKFMRTLRIHPEWIEGWHKFCWVDFPQQGFSVKLII